MKLLVKKGRTSFLVRVFIQDSSSTTGAGLTGLTSASAGLVCYRARDDDGNAGATQITLSAGTRGTWSSGGFVEKDATNMPGWYELGIPDNALATGSETVDIELKGATNMAPCPLEIQLVAFDPQDAVHLGLSAIPNATAGAANGLLISGANTGPMSISGGVTFSNSGGDALALTSSGSNGNGLNISGNGSGDGIKATAGATGNGAEIIGGATSGDGMKLSTTSGHGINATAAGTAKNGINATGAAALGANAGGHGISATGGAASTSSGGTAGRGVDVVGGAGAASTNGAAVGAKFTGGGTNTVASNAHGMQVAGTSTGDGLNAGSGTGATGNGITAVANSTNGSGASSTGAGTGDGLKCVAGASGVDLRANQTGNITGNVTGSVGSVTGAVGSVTGNVGGNVVGSVASVTARVTANTDQWAGGTIPAPNVTGVPLVDVKYLIGTALTETVGGNLAGSFKKLHDVSAPVLTTASVNQTGDNYARLGAPAGASVSADIAAVKSDTGTISTKVSGLTFTVAGKLDVNVLYWNGSAVVAPNTAGVPIVDTKYLTGTLQTARDLGANLDATVSSRLATSGYTAPDNADIATILTDAAAIKAKTDSLNFTVAGQIDANIQYVNDVLVNGVGSEASPWGP